MDLKHKEPDFGILPYLVGGTIGVLGIAWGVYYLTATFSPKYEATRRETFEQSKAYNQGMAQELQNMQFEYIKAAPEHRAALRSVILHRTADYDLNKLPPDTAAFVTQLKQEKTK
jgi:hypothetical protein